MMSKMRMIVVIFLILYTIDDSEAIFGDRFKKIKDKAKAFYKSKFGKDKTWHFLGHDASEYPGADADYRKLNQEKWDDYYNCLKYQKENLGKQRSVIPEAIQGFEGGFVKLQCKICLNPREKHNINSVEWYFAGLNDVNLQEIEYTENIYQSPDDKTLHIYNLNEENSGQYLCHLGQSLTAPYFLTVADSNEDFDEVHSENAPKGPYPKYPANIQKYNLVIDTEWGNWSPCSRCNKVGKRHRLGYCIVILRNSGLEEFNKTTTNQTNPEVNGTTTIEPNDNINIPEIDLEFFHIFKFGIPCRSHIIPESVRNLPEVKNRKHEVMTGYCKEICPEEKIFEVKDKDGNVLEKANNSAGIYSMLQGIPPIEPQVERILVYERKGANIIISCPGNLNSESPIKWQMGSKNLVPDIIYQETRGRIFISLTDKIHIKKAKIHDSSIYSCWQNNELAGTVRLIVEKKFRMNFNHHIMLFGLVLILSTFLYVFSKAFLGRKYAKTN